MAEIIIGKGFESLLFGRCKGGQSFRSVLSEVLMVATAVKFEMTKHTGLAFRERSGIGAPGLVGGDPRAAT